LPADLLDLTGNIRGRISYDGPLSPADEQDMHTVNVIEVENLTKRFGRVAAVDNISFQVPEREIFGLLGPNGAGKTTTIRCLLTLIKPTSGTARVAGMDITKSPEQVRQASGYVPQDISVDGDLTGYENLLFYAKLFFIPGKVRKQRIDEVLEFMELADRAGDLVKTYSGGMMRRLEIAQVLVNRPRVLFLDEPSIGLDPATKRVVWKYVTRLRDEFGTTILLTTHDMSEADELCDRIAIINTGKIAVIGYPEELKTTLGGDIVSVVASGPDCHQILAELGYKLLSGTHNGACDLIVEQGDREIPRIVESLRNRGITIQSISLKRATLDDVFLKYSGRRIEGVESGWRDARATRRTMKRLSR